MLKMKGDTIKIIEGQKEGFQKECQQLLEDEYLFLFESYRVYEYLGMVYYSVMMIKYGE